MKTPNQYCSICDELNCSGATRLSNALGDGGISNAVLLVSENFSVIPSVGPLVCGHSLVVTRRHTSNIIANLRQPELDELRCLCGQFLQRLAAVTPSEIHVLCFEHGSRCESQNQLCSTSHGHLHLVPLREEQLTAVLAALYSPSLAFNNFEEVRDALTPLYEYIVAFSLRMGCSDMRGVVLNATNIPSQYVRRVIADQLGIACWDWKADMKADLLRKTLALGFELNKNLEAERAGST